MLFGDSSETERPIPDHARKVFEGKIFSVWQWEQELYDGSTATFEGLERPDTVHVLGVLPDGQILLVEDEQPHRSTVLTPAGGRIDPGETPEKAAHREFREETGYEIGTLVPWYVHRPSSKTAWVVYAYIGRDVRQVGEATPEPGERIALRTYSFEEFLQLGYEPKLRNTEIRIMLLEALLDPEKKKDLRSLIYGADTDTD